MLPLLKRKQSQNVGLLVKERGEPQQDDSAAIESCATALIIAVHLKDTKGVAEALKNAFDILESMPHEEAEHVEPHSFAAQNIKAGENR